MPQVTDGPKELNDLLEAVYSDCISRGGEEGSCSAQSWSVARNRGWIKENDSWIKKEDTFTPPRGVSDEAKRGLRLREKYGRGGTLVGMRRAHQLANRQAISLDTLRRMKAFFDRHESSKDTPPDDGNGQIAWLLWGGDSGRRWAESELARMEKSRKVKKGLDGFSETGVHAHAIHRALGLTQTDGAHCHYFNINGELVMTEEDGVHVHEIPGPSDDYLGKAGSEHLHILTLPSGEIAKTQLDGAHEHGADMMEMSNFDGGHQHELQLADGRKIKSLSIKDYIDQFGLSENEPEPMPGLSTLMNGIRSQVTQKIRKLGPFEKSIYMSEPKRKGYLGAIDDSQMLKDFMLARNKVAVFGIPYHAKRAYFMKKGDQVGLSKGTYKVDPSWMDAAKQAASTIKEDFMMDGYATEDGFYALDLPYLKEDLTDRDFIERRMMLDRINPMSEALKVLPVKFSSVDNYDEAMEFARRNGDNKIGAKAAFGPYLATDPNFMTLEPTIKADLLVYKQEGSGSRGAKTYLMAAMQDGKPYVVGKLTMEKELKSGQSVTVAAGGFNFQPGQLDFDDLQYLKMAEAPMNLEDVYAAYWEMKGSVTKIKKVDDEQRLVYGVVLEPDVADLQGDIMSAEDIEKTAHAFMKKSRVIGFGHTRKETATPVESYIARKDFKMGSETIKTGSWILGVHVENDDTWQKIKNGEINSFSIGGTGQREALDD